MMATSLMRNPFEGLLPGTHLSRAGQVGVEIHPRVLASLMLVGTWVGAGEALQAEMSRHLGFPAPERTGQVASDGVQCVMRVGPEEFWVLQDTQADGGAAWRSRIACNVGTVSDLSHARSAFLLEGPAVKTLLAKMLALDLREANFPVGQVRHSAHHHVPWLLHRLGPDRFDVLVMTTYAHDALHSTHELARELGLTLHATQGLQR